MFMDSKKNVCKTIDEYIAQYPAEIQKKLEQIRSTVKAAAPQAVEKISYGMPALDQNGILVYFAAFKDHIGFFPTGSGREAFTKELAGYAGGKGTVQIPLDQALPLELIGKIVKFRVTENQKKAALKKAKPV
jgi:uncharacterized protein YdhG (YjbR/CyaY superfamily)